MQGSSRPEKDFPVDSVVKNPPAMAGDKDSISASGRSLGERNGNPFQYSCLENSMDRGVWWATVHEVTKSQIRLSDSTITTTAGQWGPILRPLSVSRVRPWVLWTLRPRSMAQILQGVRSNLLKLFYFRIVLRSLSRRFLCYFGRALKVFLDNPSISVNSNDLSLVGNHKEDPSKWASTYQHEGTHTHA